MVQYVRDYLQQLPDTKDVFLRFRASKASKGEADIISKGLTAQNRKQNELTKHIKRTAAQNVGNLAADKQKQAFVVNEAIVKEWHLNFAKIPLLSH